MVYTPRPNSGRLAKDLGPNPCGGSWVKIDPPPEKCAGKTGPFSRESLLNYDPLSGHPPPPGTPRKGSKRGSK